VIAIEQTESADIFRFLLRRNEKKAKGKAMLEIEDGWEAYTNQVSRWTRDHSWKGKRGACMGSGREVETLVKWKGIPEGGLVGGGGGETKRNLLSRASGKKKSRGAPLILQGGSSIIHERGEGRSR